ncbi:MAG TPA: glycosyltransferase [Thermoanaerobaculia bacterium]|nr:glycosyltransferase [Thermoanaerobaculia bacterium]
MPASETSAAGCLVVTGMHRSGTSLLASFLRAAGINLGETFYPADGANPLGYFEDLEFLELQREMMLACTLDESGWRDFGWTESQRLDFSQLSSFRSRAEALVRKRQGAARLWGWKDPRTTILLDFWDEILPSARYLFIYRAPWEVASSIAVIRTSPFQEHPDFVPRIWSFYNRQVVDFYRRHRDRCLLVAVSSLLSRPEEVLALIRSKLNLPLPVSQDGGAILRSLRGNGGRLGATAATASLWRLSASCYPRETQLLAELEELADLAAELPLPAGPAALAATSSAAQASPTISVVIPCFNQFEFLLDAVASVEDSAGAVFELVIVNDGSTDPFTLDVLGRLRAAGHRILDQPHRGVGAARNAGIRATRGRYILPLDADNRIRPSYLRRATELLDAAPEVGVVYGDTALFGKPNGPWRMPEFNLDEMAVGNRLGACAAFRRTVWEQCGGYDEHIEPGWQDWDYWLSVAATGCQFVHLPEVLLDSRAQSESMSSGLNQPEIRRRNLELIAAKHAAIFQPRLPRLLAERDASWLQAEARAAHLEQSLEGTRTDLEAARRDLQSTRLDLEAARGELQEARSDVVRSREHIEFMLGTRAWRLRSGFQRLRAALGLARRAS